MTVADRFDPRDVAWQQDNHFCLGLMIGVVRLAAGPSWRPAEVHLQTDEAPGLRDAESLAGARVAFRQPETMVAIPRALLARGSRPLPGTEVPTDARGLEVVRAGPRFRRVHPTGGRDAVLRRRAIRASDRPRTSSA